MVNLYDVFVFEEGPPITGEAVVSYIGITYGEMTDKVMAAVELDLVVVIKKSERKFLEDKKENTNE